MEFAPNRGRLFREAKLISSVPGFDCPLLRDKYGPGGWWYKADWRGMKGEPPTPAAIRGTWGQWAKPKIIPIAQATKKDRIDAAFARWEKRANGNPTDDTDHMQDILECVPIAVT